MALETPMSITFYYNPMSSASRIHLSLDELGISYEKVLIDLQARDQKKPEFLALNPNGKVPTIVIDDQPMFESIAIQIYLGERFGVERGLWPALGSREHMQALTWLCWHQNSLAVPLFTYLQQVGASEGRAEPRSDSTLAEVHAMLAILDARLGERGNIVHDKWTLVDTDVASTLGWGLYTAKIDATKYRHVTAWLARFQERPVVRAHMSHAN
jgi:glutathione S-transferase